MCKLDRVLTPFALAASPTSPLPPSSPSSPAIGAPPSSPKGSRRRRLWELPDRSHCPLIGVCLPVDALRRLVAKVLDGTQAIDDYDLHCSVVADCRQRTDIAEAIQRELDRRFANALRLSSTCKHSEALAHWWRDALACGDAAAALWATLTHARCDAAVEDEVLKAIHMLQHRAGAEVRDALQRLGRLENRNAELQDDLDELRRRSAGHDLEQDRKLAQAQATVMQLRAQLIGRDTRIQALGDQLSELEAEASAHGSKSRAELVQEGERLGARIGDLQRRLQRAEQALARHRQCADEPPATAPMPVDIPPAAVAALPCLDDHAVLCVGGRPASVPAYRALIESTGGRFLHHDGGDEDSAAKLDGTLAAADVVICQTGCLSHDAYRRVKAYCKRTGKRCLFVENPSASSLRRALETV